MLYEYMKQLVVNGDGKFHVIRIGAEGQEALDVKRDIYLSDDWQVATQEEYDAQMNSAAQSEAPAEPAPEAAPEAPAEEPKAEEAPAAEEAPKAPEAPASEEPKGEVPVETQPAQES